jgi:hypothetical protein
MRHCNLVFVAATDLNWASNSSFVKDAQRHPALGSVFHHLRTVFGSSAVFKNRVPGAIALVKLFMNGAIINLQKTINIPPSKNKNLTQGKHKHLATPRLTPSSSSFETSNCKMSRLLLKNAGRVSCSKQSSGR